MDRARAPLRPPCFRGWSIALPAVVFVGATLVPPGSQTDAFPPPTGPFAVGVTERRWTDTTRLEPFTGDPYDQRTLDVRVWYPAATMRGHPPAPYFEEAQTARSVLGDEYVARAGAIRTHSALNPPVARGSRFPLVLISHSVGSLGLHYTALAEELASQGYVVVAPTHSFGSLVTLLTRGRVASLHSSWVENRRTTQEAALFWWEAMANWARDLSFSLDQISLEHTTTTERFGGRLDLSHVVVVGHGHGGTAALFAAQIDRRFRAAVVLDGDVRSPNVQRGLDFPLLWIESDRGLVDTAEAAQLFRASPAEYDAYRHRLDANRDSLRLGAPPRSYDVEIAGVTTAYLSDLAGLAGGAGRPGAMDPSRAVAMVRDLVLAFVAMHTERGNPEEIVAVAAAYPNVSIRRLGTVR